MKRAKKVLGAALFVLLMVICLLPKSVLADTVLSNGQTKSFAKGDTFQVTVTSDTDVLFTGTQGIEIWYGMWDYSSYKFNLNDGAYVASLTQGTWKFKVWNGSGDVKVEWTESNDSPARAKAFSLKQGNSRRFSDEPRYRYYLLRVSDPSAKYTFTNLNSSTHIDIIKGKIETYVSAEVDYRFEGQEPHSLVLTQGYYTICGTAFSQNVEFKVKREKWVGITKLTPTGKGKIIGVQGTRFDYKVKYEPKNANSTISVEPLSSGNLRLKLKSQANGVAIFEVNYDVDDAGNVKWTYDPEKSDFNKVRFSTEEGITADAEMITTPKAPTLDGTLTGSTKAISIPVMNGTATKFVAYYKNGSTWKQCGSALNPNRDGLTHYINCANLKAGKTYTFRVYSFADKYKGEYLQVKGVTAYNLKPSNAKATCTKAVFHKRSKDYEWKFNWTRGWYKVEYTDYTTLTIKTTYKAPANARGTYVTVNGKKLKSGKTFTSTVGGRSKAGKKGYVILQSVRKSANCIAYGPSVKVAYTMKAAQ